MPCKLTKITQKFEAIAAKTKLGYWLATRYYKDIVRKEIKLANITRRDNILCIGGGMCPSTAILLHQATGAQVTVIDNCKHCVPKAREVIKKLGLSKHIRVVYKDGETMDIGGYTVVHFALQVSPLQQVFTQVEKRATPGTRLLMRRPKNGLGKLYCPMCATICKLCNGTTHKKGSNVGRTLLFVKQHGVAA